MAVKPHGEHATVNALSKLLGSTRRTIAARIRSAGLKSTGKRRGFALYQVAAVRALLEVPTDPDKMTGFQRRAHFQAEILKRQLIDMRKQLVPREEAEQELQRAARILDAAMDYLSRRLARGLGAHVELKIRGHLSEVRRELRRIEADRQSRWARKVSGADAEHGEIDRNPVETPDA
jgi:hypothetical protein